MLITYLKLSQVKSIPHGPFLPNQCAAYLQICCLICTDLKLNNKILLQEQKAEKDGGGGGFIYKCCGPIVCPAGQH